MFDFRYHALSLVAVFLALGIGILLGATIGDSLVSEANRGLSSSLHQDVVDARKDARQAHAQLGQRDRVIGAAFPMLARNELAAQRVALIASGGLPKSVESEARESVEVAGGSLDSQTILGQPGGAKDLADAVGRRYAGADLDAHLLEQLGRRIATDIVRGGGVVRRLHQALPDVFRGDYRGADSVTLYRTPPSQSESDVDRRNRTALENGIIEGLRREDIPVVGVEESRTDPSQVGWYKDQKLSSVDSVDLPGGRLALVFALAGEQGAFGLKGSADSALPKLPPRAGR